MPRRIEFVRDPNYWARDMGVAKGQNNFDRVVYRYYQDNAIAMEAFKAGEFDFLMEYSARRWARQHQGPKWSDGRIVKEEFPNGFGHGLPVVRPQHAPAGAVRLARAQGDQPRVRLRGDQRLQAVQADQQRVLEHAVRDDRHARPGRACPSGAVPQRAAARGVRPRVGAPAQRHVAERAAREPEAGPRAARVGGLEGRRRRHRAQREGRAARVRVPRDGRRAWARRGRVRAQPGQDRHRPQVAPRRLLALPQADGDVRLRHGR